MELYYHSLLQYNIPSYKHIEPYLTSPKFFTLKLVRFIGFSESLYLVLFTFPLHDMYDECLT